MRRVVTVVALICLPAGAFSDPASHCGWAENLCKCSAVFAVLESVDGDLAFEARLRSRSQELREGVYSYRGQRAGDAAIDARIKALRDHSNDLQDTIDLAQVLSDCEPFLTGVAERPLVIVTP